MNAPTAIRAKAKELTDYLRDAEARARATADEGEQLVILAEAMTVLGAEAIRAHGRAELLAERVAELEALAGLNKSLPVM